MDKIPTRISAINNPNNIYGKARLLLLLGFGCIFGAPFSLSIKIYAVIILQQLRLSPAHLSTG